MLFSQLERKAMSITVCEALQNPHHLQGTCYRVIFGCLSVISDATLVDAWTDYEPSQQVSQFLDVLITFAAARFDRVKLDALRDVMTCDHGPRAGFEQNMHSVADRRLQAEAASHSGRHTIYIILDIALRHVCTVCQSHCRRPKVYTIFLAEKKSRKWRTNRLYGRSIAASFFPTVQKAP
jgi:hypothetical protein